MTHTVYFEQKQWDDCLKECEKAIDIGRENKVDHELIAKSEYKAKKIFFGAIKRNPSDAKLYSTRAAYYTKLIEFRLVLKDSEGGIKIDPTFIKCYLRKGHTLMAMKDLGQAMATFCKALEIDPNCQNLRYLNFGSFVDHQQNLLDYYDNGLPLLRPMTNLKNLVYNV
ncbi:unnamed protein product [Rotaria sordida]|uniref:Uncharacterized protein n=1 Tax=Rotaria sordida TaxID=392033 RepID=A0A818PVK4_9BILA|nr:unnamed protein product [Rotaria sordida]